MLAAQGRGFVDRARVHVPCRTGARGSERGEAQMTQWNEDIHRWVRENRDLISEPLMPIQRRMLEDSFDPTARIHSYLCLGCGLEEFYPNDAEAHKNGWLALSVGEAPTVCSWSCGQEYWERA